ncbi:hypothetical protein [Streptomyces sp. NPDC001205]
MKGRTRIALIAAGAALAGTAALSPASAQAAPEAPAVTMGKGVVAPLVSSPGPTYQASDGWCHYRNWGGSFYCDSQYDYILPNGYHQVFVIGTDKEVFSRWESPSGVSTWANLHGQCISPGQHSVDMWEQHGWTFTIACVGNDGQGWLNTRYSDGSWSDWKGPYDLVWN